MYNPVNIKILMAAQDVNIAELARRTGRTETTIRTVLKGGDTRTSTLEAIAKALTCSEADFYLPSLTSKLVNFQAI